jgi:uncharacterized protein YdeI (YjbR/CyaY-like superfamily)
MGKLDDLERVHPADRAEWRAWLAENHATSPGVWLVTWRRASGRTPLAYEDAVEEALCVGWVDSLGRAVDAERTSLLYTPRKSGSGWSRPNKQRVARLEEAGLMRPAGRAVVEAAIADGSWTMLDDVEDLVEPPELRALLDADPAARAHWDAFPRSAKRGLLEWIVQARRPETRARRIAETAEAASRGERANEWRRRERPG